MSSKAEQEEHEKRSEAAKKAAETRAKNREDNGNGEEEAGVVSGGPTMTPDEPRHVERETLAEAGEPQPNPNTIDDGVEDVELGPPVVGQFVKITDGDYAGRFAVYLGDVGVIPDDEPVKIIQVRTRDADNLTVDVQYGDVSSTTYSGGR